MKLPVPIREIGDFSAWNLHSLLPPASDDRWDRWTLRQKSYAVHSHTRSIAFRWLDPAWEPGRPLAVQTGDDAGPALRDAVAGCVKALESHFGGPAVRVMFAELRPGGEITPHVDRGASLTVPHRCHVPVTTNPGVEFLIDGVPHHLREGIAYEIDNTRLHAVVNRGSTPRVHLICDVLPTAAHHAIQAP